MKLKRNWTFALHYPADNQFLAARLMKIAFQQCFISFSVSVLLKPRLSLKAWDSVGTGGRKERCH